MSSRPLSVDAAVSAEQPAPRSRRRFARIYDALAIVSVLAVIATLYFGSLSLGVIGDFVSRNQIWADRQFALADLQRAATFLIAPGNEVIKTNDVNAARSVRDRALADFDHQIKEFQVELAGLVPPKFADQITNAFDMLEHERDMLVSTSNAVFDAVAGGRADEARTAMVAMDQRLFELTAVFSECNRIFQEIQRSEFAAQSAYARSIERDKYVFSGFVILVMFGAILYGARLRRQIGTAETSG
jgi:hypothetical protein